MTDNQSDPERTRDVTMMMDIEETVRLEMTDRQRQRKQTDGHIEKEDRADMRDRQIQREETDRADMVDREIQREETDRADVIDRQIQRGQTFTNRIDMTDRHRDDRQSRHT